MKHAREDYNRIQDPEGKIPEDEPVFLIRGQDVCAPETIKDWIRHAQECGASEEIVAAARGQYFAVCEWQLEHLAKVPDM